ncbi:endonuclease/exonuclease/phosphatase family protein [Persicobacter psychrovividus]
MMKKMCVIALLCLFAGQLYAQKINVGTYNLRYYSTNDGEHSWGERGEQVKAQIRYHDFDIFGTQEGHKEQLDDIASLPNYAYIGLSREGKGVKGEHSAIVYRTDKFKLLDHGDFWLSKTPEKASMGWDAHYKRICSWGLFEQKSNHKQFYFFNVHLDNAGEIARVEGAKLMLKKIKKINKKHLPQFLTGDFNMTADHESIGLVKKQFLDAHDHCQTPRFGPEGTYNAFDVNFGWRRIDFIFVSKEIPVLKYGVLSYIQKKPRFASDHFPVLIQTTLD